MARILHVTLRLAGVLLLLASLSCIFVTEIHRQRLHRQQLEQEISSLQTMLSNFKSLIAYNETLLKGPYALPPLSTILNDDGSVVGNPQILLQFAIVGFGKCGTSSLMHWLEMHPELQMLNQEVWALTGRDPGRLIRRLHRKLRNPLQQRGYKCPGDLLAHFVMDYYRNYWPQTKLLVGVRHPIHWFQSLYNFRIQNFKNFAEIPHPNKLIGVCESKWSLICMGRGFFGYHLMKLGKQYANGVRETLALERNMLDWMGASNKTDLSVVTPLPNQLFMFEIQQLSEKNLTRHMQFKSDIQHYLNLTHPLTDTVHFKPGMEWHETLQQRKDALKIDICQDQYLPARLILMQMSRMTSEWIRNVFLELPGVFVSSKDHVRSILATEWMVDPCGDKVDSVSEAELDRIMVETTGQPLEGLALTRARFKVLTA
ncbi:hypothetical protein MPSEU_000761100 [Mayamaea pseudoterrestris]|nr:hypothetical protein MPSEU_000761100 [Mayamaea pseudoterrestris]